MSASLDPKPGPSPATTTGAGVHIDVFDGPPTIWRTRCGPTCAAACAPPPRSCRPSGSTTTGAASCSTPSPACPSTTRPSMTARSCGPRAPAIVAGVSQADTLVELGSRAPGTRPACCSTPWPIPGQLARFGPFEIREPTLRSTADAISRRGYTGGRGPRRGGRLRTAPGSAARAGGRRLVAFLGRERSGTSRRPIAGRTVLAELGCRRHGAGRTGSCSAPTWSRTGARLEAAYDDAAGVTAEFNLNVLAVVNRELDANFDLDGSSSTWPASIPSEEWIEMRLRSRGQTRPCG